MIQWCQARRMTFLTFAADGFAIGAWSVAVARIQHGLGVSDAAMGWALLAFAGGAIVFMVLAGRLVGRWGACHLSIVSGLTAAVALALTAWMPSLVTLSLLLILLGAGHGSLDVVMNTRASALERDKDKTMMSSFHAGWSIGGLAGAGTAGGLIMLSAPPALLTGGPALILALAMVTVALYGDRTPAGQVSAPVAVLAWPSRAVSGLGVLAFLSLLAEGIVANWSSLYLQAVLPDSGGGIAVGYGAFALAMLAGRVAGDRLVTCWGIERLLPLGALMAAIGLAMVLLWPSLITAILGFGMMGAGLANVVPQVFSRAASRHHDPNMGIAMVATMGYGGLLLGPALIGGLAGVASLRLALAMLVLMLVVMGLGSVWAWRSTWISFFS
ncbi:MFS transporter [Larsenimonas rhizosphaerae]|uniref:MFS transporter n=1 Tax=Larsenimonas rhizosphaerae TaxID=2944682 RepID=UPI0020340D1D|nr:MFS transporter [Larsenimonas rhizosphaerae]MCM2129376.1 MFS transporter [Larsenimonas rhizosphaerae]